MNDPLNAVDCLTKILASATSESAIIADSNEELNMDGENFILKVLELRGLLLHEQKAFKFAVSDFSRAISINHDRPGNYYFRGNCHSKLGNFELAIEDFCLAEEHGFSNVPFLLMCKGIVMRLVGDNENAVEVFSQAIDEVDDDPEGGERHTGSKLLLCRLYLYKSLSFINMKEFKKSLQTLLDAPKAVEGTLHSAVPLAGSRYHPPPAVRREDRFESVIDPSLQWLISYHVALSHFMLQDYGKSMKFLKSCLGKLRSSVPDDVSLGSCIYFFCVSACLTYKSNHPEEESILRRCVELLNECLDTDWCKVKTHNAMLCTFALGKCYQRLECHEEAAKGFTEALSYAPGDKEEVASYILFRRAWSYKALGQYSAAAEDFESAKLIKCDDPNFSINYRQINDVAFIEIVGEPDTVEPFPPIFPSFDV